MRKHIVNCTVEGISEQIIDRIQIEINNAYVEKVGNILKSSTISKDDKIFLIGQLQEKLKINTTSTT